MQRLANTVSQTYQFVLLRGSYLAACCWGKERARQICGYETACVTITMGANTTRQGKRDSANRGTKPDV